MSYLPGHLIVSTQAVVILLGNVERRTAMVDVLPCACYAIMSNLVSVQDMVDFSSSLVDANEKSF